MKRRKNKRNTGLSLGRMRMRRNLSHNRLITKIKPETPHHLHLLLNIYLHSPQLGKKYRPRKRKKNQLRKRR
jgi:hypothetical protein